ncbi:MAG: DNA polymerase III subunit delta' [Pseudomonadota bacterium]
MARRTIEMERDALPEADRLQPFPHPRQTPTVIGHSSQRRELADAIDADRPHHAWLITGPVGVGKATLSYAAARYLLATSHDRRADAPEPLVIDPDSKTARQVEALSHPGLLLIRRVFDPKDKRFRTVINVDEVRRLRSFLSHTAGGGASRAVIVDAADDLNISAANALLKSLEEPPPRTLFFLVCNRPGSLLPTIRSRCRVLALSPLEADATLSAARAAAAAADPPVARDVMSALEALGASADGCPGRLLMLAQGGGQDVMAWVDRLFSGLPRVDWTQVHTLADSFSKTDQTARFNLFADMLLDQLSTAVQAKARAGAWPPAVLASLAELWETTARAKAQVDRLNLDRKSFVLDTVARLSTAWPSAR